MISQGVWGLGATLHLTLSWCLVVGAAGPKGQLVCSFDPEDETAHFGERVERGGKRRRGTSDSSGGGEDLSDGLRSAACRQGSKALEGPTLPGYDHTGIPGGGEKRATLNC